MDPSDFSMDRLFEVLVTIIVLSFFVERALAIIFEHRLWTTHMAGKGVKAPIAFLLAWGVCTQWDFDAISTTILVEQTPRVGHLLTAAIIAGGSKASIKLFHDVMGAMSDAEKKRKGQP
ncbi:MAG: hypothetical protein OXS35_07370 [Dehalococcoidia bacterium]|nr:hypothetical protein [Dehalococcoidia bacterium]